MILSETQQKCEEKVREILGQIDPTTSEEIYNNIGDSFEALKNVTEIVFEDPSRATLLYDNIRRIFVAIALERGYLDKMKYKEKLADDILNGYRWFKLYSTIILKKENEFRYEFVLNDMKQIRDDTLSHGLIPVSEKGNVAIIGQLVLMWYFLEDLFNVYAEILLLSDDEISKGVKKLEGYKIQQRQTTELYGFINRLMDDIGFIISYHRGQDKGTRFRLQDVNFFPDEGDIVEYGDIQKQNEAGKDYDTFTAIYVRKVKQ